MSRSIPLGAAAILAFGLAFSSLPAFAGGEEGHLCGEMGGVECGGEEGHRPLFGGEEGHRPIDTASLVGDSAEIAEAGETTDGASTSKAPASEDALRFPDERSAGERDCEDVAGAGTCWGDVLGWCDGEGVLDTYDCSQSHEICAFVSESGEFDCVDPVGDPMSLEMLSGSWSDEDSHGAGCSGADGAIPPAALGLLLLLLAWIRPRAH